MTAFLLTAVGGARRKTGVAFTADLFVAVVFLGECLERRLDDSTS